MVFEAVTLFRGMVGFMTRVAFPSFVEDEWVFQVTLFSLISFKLSILCVAVS